MHPGEVQKRALPGLLVLVAVVAIGFGTTRGCGDGCVSCETLTEDESPQADLLGRVVDVDGRIVRLEAYGEAVSVWVFGGNPRVLEEGTTYRFPVTRGEVEDGFDRALQTSLPSDCDCGGDHITHENGDPVDQSILGLSPDVGLIATMAGAALALTVATWLFARR